MQNEKTPTQTAQPQEEPATDTQTTQPTWMRPKIKMYNEEDLLRTVAVFGCSPQA